ncbi:MAG: DUF4367 domain-containing protein [Clostridia bacterium]|nr:DUF4367 domain-containing protein [Clostridia bacterium]
MKRFITILLAVLTAVSLAACAKKAPEGEKKPNDSGNVGIANPWIDCDTLVDAAKLAGFDVTVPGKFEGYPNKVYQAVEKSMIQVLYFDGDPAAETSSMIMVRKGTGSDDISGDYNDYPEKGSVNVNGVDVSIKGKDGLIFNAVWTWEGYSFAINADKGITKEALTAAIEEMLTVAG